jgi:hypothetical protein
MIGWDDTFSLRWWVSIAGMLRQQPPPLLKSGGRRDIVDATESSQIRAMRRLQLSQTIKGLAADLPIEGDSPNRIEELLRELRRAKAYLWQAVRIEPYARSRT